MIEHRCQPEAERPFSSDREAASSSRCIGWGSNSAAKASISSRVTRRGPNVPKWPGGKSSKVSIIWGLLRGKPDCGRYLRQSQHTNAHARAAYQASLLPCSQLILPGSTFGARSCAATAAFLVRLRFELRRGERQMFEFRD